MAAEFGIRKELLDELLAGHGAKMVFENDGLVDELKKAPAERILNAELDQHLGREGEQTAGNVRNDTSPKTVLTDSGKLELAIPRNRQGPVAPRHVARSGGGERRVRRPEPRHPPIQAYHACPVERVCTRDVAAITF
jgi:transposase-like protein